ncbi:MAG: heme exporter protein CcmD [Gammaproteobacteria bacterium]|nr:heme exporter protein CcmD [Gammaproteobacteria bacterium]MCP5201004.1 heme exporter protein CcmD [Gammaproteobacteria bacterium]
MHEFLAMGGYAAYVWTSYGIGALVLGMMALGARRAERKALDALAEDLAGDDDDPTA